MTIAYLNGEFAPIEKAKISILDRGFLFGDSVYEVVPFYAGKPLCANEHLDRLENSLKCIHMEMPLSPDQWRNVLTTLLQKNNLTDKDTLIYLQISRGAETLRKHRIPENKIEATVVAFPTPFEAPSIDKLSKGLHTITRDDFRWQACHIKSTNLLGNILLLEDARQSGKDDAILIRDGIVTEGSACNTFVIKNNKIMMPVTSNNILNGITRQLISRLAKDYDISCEECDISLETLENADEIWATSASKEITPVLELNNKPVGNGKPGPLWTQFIQYFQDFRNNLRPL